MTLHLDGRSRELTPTRIRTRVCVCVCVRSSRKWHGNISQYINRIIAEQQGSSILTLLVNVSFVRQSVNR